MKSCNAMNIAKVSISWCVVLWVVFPFLYSIDQTFKGWGKALSVFESLLSPNKVHHLNIFFEPHRKQGLDNFIWLKAMIFRGGKISINLKERSSLIEGDESSRVFKETDKMFMVYDYRFQVPQVLEQKLFQKVFSLPQTSYISNLLLQVSCW